LFTFQLKIQYLFKLFNDFCVRLVKLKPLKHFYSLAI